MYELWAATELAELRSEEAERRAAIRRQHAEAIEEWEQAHPSLLRRIGTLLGHREEAEPLMARTPVQTELLGSLITEEEIRSRAA